MREGNKVVDFLANIVYFTGPIKYTQFADISTRVKKLLNIDKQ